MPTFLEPPPTDVGSMPQFWASFNLAPRRIRTVAGDGRSRSRISRSRARSPASTCGCPLAARVSCIGTSRRSGRS
jgi:hypothetical protein